MPRRKVHDESLFYIVVHPKRFSTARSVERPTIDIVRKKRGGAERVRLMFPRAMEVVEGTFKVELDSTDVPIGVGPTQVRLGEPFIQLSAKVKVGGKIFTIIMRQQRGVV